ncbi:MAG: GYD domain-containing protein [Nitrospinaceae bacterium]
MAQYLIMGNFTDAGIRNVKETISRGERFKEMARECGVEVRELMWLLGDYDVFSIAEAEDAHAVTAFLLSAGSRGFVKTCSFRAFTKDEMGAIVQKMV